MKTLLFAGLLFAFSSAIFAAEPEAILLWPDGAPGSEGQTAPENVTETGGVRRISSIHHPSLTPFLPTTETATGAAVIVLPGGAHQFLSIENEGYAAAKWLADHGVAALVLKYRLAREPNSPYKVEVHALQDAQRALRLVRSRAGEWNLDAHRVGLLGFSAGGEIVTLAATRYDAGNAQADDPIERQSSRPDFQGLMYAAIAKQLADVPKDAPPAFVCVAADDLPKVGIDTEYFQKLRAAGVSAELHVFAEGGHGFGMRQRPMPISNWPTRFYDWLGNRKFLKPAASSAK